MGKFAIHQKVKIGVHYWLKRRRNAVGIIKEILTDEGACPYLVVFSALYPGGGFTDERFEGQCLRLSEIDLEAVK